MNRPTQSTMQFLDAPQFAGRRPSKRSSKAKAAGVLTKAAAAFLLTMRQREKERKGEEGQRA